LFFLKSSGTRYVGNSIGNFVPVEVYLIGSNVPHLFRNKKVYYEQNEVEAVYLIVVKFEKDFLGESFLKLAETKGIQKLLNDAGRGLKFSKSTSYLIHNHLLGLLDTEGISGIVGLIVTIQVH
jgi:hypothetical protein